MYVLESKTEPDWTDICIHNQILQLLLVLYVNNSFVKVTQECITIIIVINLYNY